MLGRVSLEQAVKNVIEGIGLVEGFHLMTAGASLKSKNLDDLPADEVVKHLRDVVGAAGQGNAAQALGKILDTYPAEEIKAFVIANRGKLPF